MTAQIAMFLLAVTTAVTCLITEAIKKNFIIKKPNIVALIVSVSTGALVPLGYLIVSKIAITAQDVIYIIGLAALTWLCSTLGYDKVIQTITQIKR